MENITLEKYSIATTYIVKLAAAINTSLQPIVDVKQSVNNLMSPVLS